MNHSQGVATTRTTFDALQHRKNANYPVRIYIARVLWTLTWPLFRFSPRLCYGWRNLMLRCYGASIGKGVRIYPSAYIFFPWNMKVGDYTTISWDVLLYSLGVIEIGDNTLISHRVHVCAGTHDYREPNLPLLTPKVTIGSGVWICADAFVGPGCALGDSCVVGARSVVIKDVEPNSIVVGNPAKAVGRRA